MTVELLVTLIVGSILLLSLNTIVNTHLYLSQRGRDLAVSNAFAEMKIESLRSKGYLAVSTGTTDITSELPTELKKPRTGTMVVSTQETGIKRIKLTITYSEQGIPRTKVYNTYLGELGVGQ